MPNVLGQEMSDQALDILATDAVAMATRQRELREMLNVADGGGASVVRIRDIRKIFGWQNDRPIRLTT